MQFALLLGGLLLGANGATTPELACLPPNLGCQSIIFLPVGENVDLESPVKSWEWDCDPSSGEWRTTRYGGVADCSGGTKTVHDGVKDGQSGENMTYEFEPCGTPCLNYYQVSVQYYQTTDCTGEPYIFFNTSGSTLCDGDNYKYVCNGSKTVIGTEYSTDQCMGTAMLTHSITEGVCESDYGRSANDTSMMAVTVDCYASNSVMKKEGTQSMIRALIGVVVIVLIGVCVWFGIKARKKQKQSQQKENVLMHSLNEQQIIVSDDKANVLYDLLKEWSLQQYGTVLIEERGYDEMEQWKDLRESELEQMGFKEGHARKFVKMVREHCTSMLLESEVLQLDTEASQNNVKIVEEGIAVNNAQNEGEGFTNQ